MDRRLVYFPHDGRWDVRNRRRGRGEGEVLLDADRITPSERILPGEAVSLKLDSISNED